MELFSISDEGHYLGDGVDEVLSHGQQLLLDKILLKYESELGGCRQYAGNMQAITTHHHTPPHILKVVDE